MPDASALKAYYAAVKIACSLSCRGNCYNNAVMESFFDTKKNERVYLNQYKTRSEAEANSFNHI